MLGIAGGELKTIVSHILYTRAADRDHCYRYRRVPTARHRDFFLTAMGCYYLSSSITPNERSMHVLYSINLPDEGSTRAVMSFILIPCMP
jgi:hypothetical protein